MTQESLERLYENELAYLRKLGVEFARQRPKIADGAAAMVDRT